MLTGRSIRQISFLALILAPSACETAETATGTDTVALDAGATDGDAVAPVPCESAKDCGALTQAGSCEVATELS